MRPGTATPRWQDRSGTGQHKRPLAVRFGVVRRAWLILRDGAIAPPQDEAFLFASPREERGEGEAAASVLRTQLLDFGIARQEVGALLVGDINHDALAVLQRGLADIGAERRLMVDLAEGDLAEG